MTTGARLPWSQNDALFGAELERGRRNEFRVASRLRALGFVDVAVNTDRGLELREETFAARGAHFANQLDVRVGDHRLEVKGRALEFTGPADYPFATAYVGSSERWERRTDPPCLVVVLSEITGAIVGVPTATREEWVVERGPDHRKPGYVDSSMAAPRALLLDEGALCELLAGPCDGRDIPW